MTYKLFIDDERFPPDDGEEWKIVRNVYQAISTVSAFGCPAFISFDHDLGLKSDETLEESGYDFAWWLVNVDLSADGEFIPDDFSFYVHSQNVAGKANIEGLLNNYLAQR
jgi:hypothetical protein